VRRRAALAWALCWLTACADELAGPTQVLVSVFAEPSVASQLDRLEVRVYAADGSEASLPTQAHSFELVRSEPRKGELRLPLSFGVEKGTADLFLLKLAGYGASELEARVEHKQLVRFLEGRSRPVSITLTQSCFAVRCPGLAQTCYATASGGVPAGQCGPVDSEAPVVPLELTQDGGGFDADFIDVPPTRDAGEDAGEEVRPPAEEPVCGVYTDCAPDYPCQPSTRSGYTCRGQFAEWPMPGLAPGSKAAPSYEDDVPGVVRDRVTGLFWQKDLPPSYPGCEAGTTCTWREAKDYCDGLVLGGQRYRLPTKIELESLADETRWVPTSTEPASIDVDFFPGTPTSYFWTGSQIQWQAKARFHAVSFGGGHTQVKEPEQSFAVRCVRSEFHLVGTPRDRYRVDQVADTISDLRTTLTWQRSPNEATLDYEGAAAYCKGLGNGFRLPTAKELNTLYNPDGVRFPSVPPEFYPNAPEDVSYGAAYWTSSPFVISNERTLVVFDIGNHTSLRGLEAVTRETKIPFVTRAWCVR
jgi:hypothetical protein